jgi:hypothetical protein
MPSGYSMAGSTNNLKAEKRDDLQDTMVIATFVADSAYSDDIAAADPAAVLGA